MNKVIGFLLLAASLPAQAHHFMGDALPRTWEQGLLSGLGHPVIGLDHMAFIVAAGFLLARVPRGLWGAAALVLGSLAGAALHLGGIDIPGVEAWIALSVILSGALLAVPRAVPLSWLATGFATAGVLHGHAYAESIFGAESTPLAFYLIGFSVIQLCVAAAAFALHRWLLLRPERARNIALGVGTAAGAVGVTFLFS